MIYEEHRLVLPQLWLLASLDRPTTSLILSRSIHSIHGDSLLRTPVLSQHTLHPWRFTALDSCPLAAYTPSMEIHCFGLLSSRSIHSIHGDKKTPLERGFFIQNNY